MIGLLFYAFVALFLAGTVVSLSGVARDTRIIRTLSLACTAGASLLLVVLSLIILVSGVPFTPAAWQSVPRFFSRVFHRPARRVLPVPDRQCLRVRCRLHDGIR